MADNQGKGAWGKNTPQIPVRADSKLAEKLAVEKLVAEKKKYPSATKGQPLINKNLELVFVFASPGDAFEWRPEASHVGRRDALARIVGSAAYTSFGVPSRSTKECVFLFEDDYCLRVTPQQLVDDVPVPSESRIIKSLKKMAERTSYCYAVENIIEEYAKKKSEKHNVLALMLHEDYGGLISQDAFELPEEKFDPSIKHTCLVFLGAVKDTEEGEIRATEKYCKQTKIPLVKASVGRAADFTSKIVDVIMAHQAIGRLLPNFLRLLWESENPNSKLATAAHSGWLGLKHAKEVESEMSGASDRDKKTKFKNKGKGKGNSAADDDLDYLFSDDDILATNKKGANKKEPLGFSEKTLPHMQIVMGMLDLSRSESVYFIHRACVSHLWRSHGKAGPSNCLCFYNKKATLSESTNPFLGDKHFLVHPHMVTNLSRQHRAAPSEFNLFSIIEMAAAKNPLYKDGFERILSNLPQRRKGGNKELVLDKQSVSFDFSKAVLSIGGKNNGKNSQKGQHNFGGKSGNTAPPLGFILELTIAGDSNLPLLDCYGRGPGEDYSRMGTSKGFASKKGSGKGKDSGQQNINLPGLLVVLHTVAVRADIDLSALEFANVPKVRAQLPLMSHHSAISLLNSCHAEGVLLPTVRRIHEKRSV